MISLKNKGKNVKKTCFYILDMVFLECKQDSL